MKPYLVGIAGGSASGKGYIVNALAEHFKTDELTFISTDNYYKPFEEQPVEPNGVVNFDHPDSMRFDLFQRDLELLAANEPITVKEYTFNNPNKPDNWITYHPAPVIVAEGLLIYALPQVRRLFDLKIFVETDEHIKFSRRIRRDQIERGYPLDEILMQYEATVVPMFRQYVEPYKNECDLILPNNGHLNNGLNVLIHHFRAILNEKALGKA